MALFGLGLTSCNKDKETSGNATKGDESVVSLTIYDQRSTRGTGDTEAASTVESAVSGTVKVVVYTDAGLEKEQDLTYSTATKKTENFTLSAGTKYLYVFLNDGTRNDIPSAAGKTRVQFEQNVITTALDGTTSLPDIATDNSFLIGTLYATTTAVDGGGTEDNPVTVALSVGRLVSKVNLKDVTDVAAGGMSGTFSDPSYRIGSIAKKLFTVGQYTTTDAAKHPPLAGGGWTAFSAVHDEAPEVPVGTYNTAAFLQYAAVWKAPTEVFYVPENTTAEDASGYLYYGNTSYLQLKTKYTPTAAEVLDPTDLSQTVAVGADFWTVQLTDGTRVIVGTDPATAGTLDADIDVTEPFYKYTGGFNYHKFAIYDDDSALTSSVQKFSVLRNTYYEYEVTDIKTLGSWTDEVDPWEPVPTSTEVELEVTILPWYKIADDVTL
jgi:hypothetical protein